MAETPAQPPVAREARPERAPEPRPLLERVQQLTERVARSEPSRHTSAVSQAIDEVMEIIESLKRAVDQMEEVLELVELAERQKLADEREIDSLRRTLRQLHDRPHDRPRDVRGPREPRENRAAPQRREARPAPAAESGNPREEPERPEPEAEDDSRYSVD